MRQNKMWTIRILVLFLAVMAAGTVISRAAASALVAEVRVQKPGKGRLTYSCEGEGKVVPVDEKQIFLWPDQQVEWSAEQGSTVKAGECLVKFRGEYLEQSIEKKKAELEDLELQERQQRVSAREQARVPAAAGASQSLAEAEQGLAAASQKETEARNAYDEFLRTPVSGDTEGTQEAGIWEAKKQELEAALREAEAGSEAARQAVTQAQNAKELAAREDAAWDVNAANAAEAARLGADAVGVQAETVRTELERLQSYREAGGQILADADCVVLQAGVQPGTFTTGSEVFVTGSGGFQLKGTVKAEDKDNLKAGAPVEVRLGTGKQKTVQIDKLEFEADGTGNESGSAGENGSPGRSVVWYAPLPEHTEVQGMESFTWTMKLASAKEYEQIIPLTALRENVTEAYCLVLSEEEQMIGTVQTAKRVPVTVLEKDGESAAVTSGLRDTDKIIVFSEKYVEEGDRVRIQDE